MTSSISPNQAKSPKKKGCKKNLRTKAKLSVIRIPVMPYRHKYAVILQFIFTLEISNSHSFWHRLQLFYDDEYCGDYDEFDLANEIDKLEIFLKMAPEEIESVSTAQIELSTSKKENGDTTDENKENDSENKEV